GIVHAVRTAAARGLLLPHQPGVQVAHRAVAVVEVAARGGRVAAAALASALASAVVNFVWQSAAASALPPMMPAAFFLRQFCNLPCAFSFTCSHFCCAVTVACAVPAHSSAAHTANVQLVTLVIVSLLLSQDCPTVSYECMTSRADGHTDTHPPARAKR